MTLFVFSPVYTVAIVIVVIVLIIMNCGLDDK